MQVIDSATEAAPGSANEDLFVSGAHWAIVLDGAGRYPGEPAGCIHPVTWVVARLAEHLGSHIAEGGSRSLTAIAHDAIRATMADHGATCDLDDPLSPGAAGAIVRVVEGRVEWFVLSDCAVVVESADRHYTVTIDDRVDQLSNAPTTDAAVRTYSPDYVRSVRNRPGGFWVLGAVPSAAENALVGSLPVAECKRILLCSDGVSRLTERYSWSWRDVFSTANTGGIKALIAAVREEERTDPDPRRWRGRQHDDATAALIELG